MQVPDRRAQAAWPRARAGQRHPAPSRTALLPPRALRQLLRSCPSFPVPRCSSRFRQAGHHELPHLHGGFQNSSCEVQMCFEDLLDWKAQVPQQAAGPLPAPSPLPSSPEPLAPPCEHAPMPEGMQPSAVDGQILPSAPSPRLPLMLSIRHRRQSAEPPDSPTQRARAARSAQASIVPSASAKRVHSRDAEDPIEMSAHQKMPRR